MAEEARLALVILAVEELKRAAAFYRAAFGWTQTVDEAVYAEFALPGAVRLGLYTHVGFGRNAGQAPLKPARGDITATEIYLVVDDLSAAIARVEAAGARALSPRALRDWGDEAAYFADPDGNVVVLAQPHTPHASPSKP
ncbi:MAG TPA: VOC family protein [Ktedonobacterales bacterium]|jgi:predicted enzyme related to lactoylglutathione lyase